MKKTMGMRKALVLLLAVMLTVSGMPLMGATALAAQEQELTELHAAMDALVDPTNLRFYTDDAILSVADTLGGGYDDPQAFLDKAIADGYTYAGGTAAEDVQASTAALRELMATGADMTENSLAYVQNDGLRGKMIHRDESKATVELRVLPVLYNGAQTESVNSITALKAGDRITFAVELETNYYVSAAELPIVFDSTKFNLVDTDGNVYAYDGGSSDADDISEACPKLLVDTDCLRAKIKNNYTVEGYSVSSPCSQYPQAYQTPEYMRQYKILLIEIFAQTSQKTVPQIFTKAYSRLCTFTLQVRDDVAFNSSANGTVGTPAGWYAAGENYTNLFAVTRAAGMQADGVTPARNGSDAVLPYMIFDVESQFGQTATTQITTVRFSASSCRHSFKLVERKLPTQTEDGCEKYECTKCGAPKEIILPANGATLALSDCKAKVGNEVDVAVTMTGNPGIVALLIELEYDRNVLELIEVKDGDLLGEGTIEIGGNLDKSPFKVLWEDAVRRENYTADGTLVTFRFRVRSDAPSGDTELKLSYSAKDTFNKDLKHQSFAANGAFIRVGTALDGDADLDGVLSTKDSTVIRRFLVDTLTAKDIDLENADFDHDGLVSLKDSTRIKRYLAGGWDEV